MHGIDIFSSAYNHKKCIARPQYRFFSKRKQSRSCHYQVQSLFYCPVGTKLKVTPSKICDLSSEPPEKIIRILGMVKNFGNKRYWNQVALSICFYSLTGNDCCYCTSIKIWQVVYPYSCRFFKTFRLYRHVDTHRLFIRVLVHCTFMILKKF